MSFRSVRGRMATSIWSTLLLLVLIVGLFPSSTVSHDSLASLASYVANTTVEYPSGLQKRADLLTIAAALQNGRRLACLMQATKEDAENEQAGSTETQFTSFDQMTAQWTYALTSAVEPLSDIGPDALGPSGAQLSGNTQDWDAVQLKTVDVPMTTKSRTSVRIRGSYENVFNIGQGAIIAKANYSPLALAISENVEEGEYKAKLPKPHKWSDVIFLQYQRLAGDRIRLLQHIFRASIDNDDTKNVIQEALAVSDGANVWSDRATFTPTAPGATETAENRAFYALLYTPNIRGIAWLLIQHKAALGVKYIHSISLYQDKIGLYNVHVHICPWRPELNAPPPAKNQRRMESAALVCP